MTRSGAGNWNTSFNTQQIAAMNPATRDAILNGSLKTDQASMAAAREWQFMNAGGYKQATTINDVPPGAQTYSLAVTSPGYQSVNPKSGSSYTPSQVTGVSTWYKEAPQPAAPAATAATAAPAAPPKPVSGGTSSNPDADPSPTPSMLKGGVKQDRVETPGALKNYLDNQDTDYNRWLADRNKEPQQQPADGSKSWDRYFKDEFTSSNSRYGDPLPTRAKDDRRLRMAASGDFTSTLNKYIGNYSETLQS